MRPWIAIVAVAACTTPEPGLVLDFPAVCDEITAQVLDPALLPGWQVEALAVQDVAGARAWVLARDPGKRRMLVAWPEGPRIDLSALDGRFDLVPGAAQGEAWLLLDRPSGARLWRLGDPARGEVIEAPDLAAFPEGEDVWARRLLLVDGVPHLLAAPPAADASTLQLPLARLDRDTLAITDAWNLEFWWTCGGTNDTPDGGGCIETPYETIDEIELLGTTQADGAPEAIALIGLHAVTPSETPELEGLHYTILSSLQLYPVTGDGPPDAYRLDQMAWADVVPLVLSPAQIVADGAGMYVLGGTIQPPDAMLPGLMKDQIAFAGFAGGRGQSYPQIFASLDIDDRSHLLQVGGQAALGQFLEGEWRVAPVGAGTVVDTDRVARLPVPDGTVVRGAGRGQFLVRPPDGPALRVALDCADVDAD